MKGILAYFKNLRFRSKLLISYLIICIIPIIVLGSSSYHQANSFLKKQAVQGLSASIKQEAENVNFRCKQYEAVIDSVVYNFRFQQIFSSDYKEYSEMYRDYVDPFFNNILFLYKDILQISVFTDNAEIQRGEYVLPSILLKDFPWYHDALNSKQKMLWSGKNGKLVCTRVFTKDYVKKDDKPALLFLNIDLESLFKGFDNIKSDIYGIVVIDSKGQVVVSKSKNCNVLLDMDQLKSLNGYDSYIKVGKEDFICVKADISGPAWTMYYYTPSKSISVDARSIAGVTALITGICLVALGFLIWIFSNTFVRRINKLNKKMEMVENGNLKIDVSSQSKDEIGELTNRFGKMLNNINLLINDVYKSKIVQKESEMRALQAQINPHFLYNTLSVINWKAIQIDAMEISRITSAVSKFYRTVLNKGKNVISVRDEVDNAKAYMEIQLVMHNNKFEFVCDIDEEIFKFNMINLLLQPILENALEHGIDMKKKGEKGILSLQGHFSDDGIDFVIEDNGPGMAEELMKEILTQNSKGYGLKNVHERIRMFFGDKYGLRINSELGKGSTVIVSIPRYRMEEGAAEKL